MVEQLRKINRNRAADRDAVSCPDCGEQNRADARFCRACGAVLAAPNVVEGAAPGSWTQRLPFGSRRARLIAGLVTAAAVIVAIAAAALGGGSPESTGSSLTFATVRRTRLVSVRSLDGEVTARGQGPSVLSRLSGTVTEIAAEGTKVERGETLYSIDGEPVFLLYGSLPAWRDIGGPDSGDGADVEQLEKNLEALGFETGAVDQTFTATTRSAVEAWTSSVGLPKVGVVRLGRVVFARAALTVAKHLKTVGAPARDGEAILSTVSSEKVLKVTLRSRSELGPGDEVTIAVPGKKAPGKVASVEAAEAQGPGEETRLVVATVVPDEADALAEFDEGYDVDVEVFGDARENVLVVPVTALVATQTGGYVVEVDRGGGRTELVKVTPGLYAVNLVEVEGDLKEGDRVVVP